MPFWRTYYHIVWATKYRAPLLTAEVENRLYPYLTSKAAESDARIYAANGGNDHVHLVASIPPKIAVATFVKRLKGASSFDLNHAGLLTERFSWQRGYGVWTLGESQLERAIQYVRRQKEHHAQQTLNRWLEQVDEFDEGPPENVVAANQVREKAAPYGPATDGRFP